MDVGYHLCREIGEMIRVEREKRLLNQRDLSTRLGISQQQLSRIERGDSATTTSTLQRIFAAFGMRVRLEIAPLEAELDAGIDRVRHLSEADRLSALAPHTFVLKRLGTVPFVFTGRIGAFIQGVPVPVDAETAIDIVVAEADLPLLDQALSMMNTLRWDPRWRDFIDFSISPLRPGPMRWRAVDTEIVATVVPRSPGSLAVLLSGEQFKVLPLTDIVATHPDVASLVDHVRIRAAQRETRAGSGH